MNARDKQTEPSRLDTFRERRTLKKILDVRFAAFWFFLVWFEEISYFLTLRRIFLFRYFPFAHAGLKMEYRYLNKFQ